MHGLQLIPVNKSKSRERALLAMRQFGGPHYVTMSETRELSGPHYWFVMKKEEHGFQTGGLENILERN